MKHQFRPRHTAANRPLTEAQVRVIAREEVDAKLDEMAEQALEVLRHG